MADPRRLGPDAPEIPAVLALIRECFAYMDARIDPPSSMHRLTEAGIAGHSRTGEVWVIGAPVACVMLTCQPDALYVGKLAVAASARGQGHARTLIDLAATRARALNLPCLRLQSRVELTEVHAILARMGFAAVGTGTHPGYDRPTSIVMELAV